MIISSIDFSERRDGHHFFRDHKFEATKIGSGVGVLVTFSMSPIDKDFQEILYHHEIGLWAPSTNEITRIQGFLDHSDLKTSRMLNKSEWRGPRPLDRQRLRDLALQYDE